MDQPHDAYELSGPLPELQRPVLVVHLAGWIDASGVAAAALAAVERACETALLATFDSDTFVDYRARRPTMEIREGINSRLVWSDIELRHGTAPDGRDVLLLTGPEPDMQWKRFAGALTGLVTHLGAEKAIGFGAYPFAAPHTRPTQLSCTSPSAEMVAATRYDKGTVDVPAGMSSVLEHSLTEAGVPMLGLWARVPHYISAMAFPAASVALLHGLADATGIRVPAEELEREAEQQRRRIDQLVAGNDEHVAMVHQLESRYDQAAEQAEAVAGSLAGDLPSGDDLAAEFERFLRDQGD